MLSLFQSIVPHRLRKAFKPRHQANLLTVTADKNPDMVSHRGVHRHQNTSPKLKLEARSTLRVHRTQKFRWHTLQINCLHSRHPGSFSCGTDFSIFCILHRLHLFRASSSFSGATCWNPAFSGGGLIRNESRANEVFLTSGPALCTTTQLFKREAIVYG